MTPLLPKIDVVPPDFKAQRVCSCCADYSETVMQLRFRWEERQENLLAGSPKQGGGTAICLCQTCRGTLFLALLDDYTAGLL